MLINYLYNIKNILRRSLTIPWKQRFLWLNPHVERFTLSTKLNPHLCFSKCLTPTYTVGFPTYTVGLEIPSTAPPPTPQPKWGVETMQTTFTSHYLCTSFHYTKLRLSRNYHTTHIFHRHSDLVRWCSVVWGKVLYDSTRKADYIIDGIRKIYVQYILVNFGSRNTVKHGNLLFWRISNRPFAIIGSTVQYSHDLCTINGLSIRIS